MAMRCVLEGRFGWREEGFGWKGEGFGWRGEGFGWRGEGFGWRGEGEIEMEGGLDGGGGVEMKRGFCVF